MSPLSLLHSPVTHALRESRIPCLRHLSVEETSNTVIISGSVSTYYLKQLAQETIMPLLENRELFNRVKVIANGPAPDSF